jgi:hypothetical protein
MSSTDHSTIHAARHGARPTIALITGPELAPAGLAEDLTRWHRLMPSATWTSVRLAELNPTSIVHCVAALRIRRSLERGQLILFGTGDTARRALELVVQGALDCAGMLAVDIPCSPLSCRVAFVPTAIRLVVSRDGSLPPDEDLVGQLRHADIDLRVIGLGPAAANKAAIASAAETFLLELVAMVGRQCGNGA